ncbi:MAG: hypothetical protein WD042_03235 [Phycisphaeraceae bacterium]
MAAIPRKRRVWRYIVLAIVLLPIAAFVAALALTRMDPPAWKAHQAAMKKSTPAQREAKAVSLEARLTALTSYTRADGVPGIVLVSASGGERGGAAAALNDGLGVRQFHVEADEFNAWLETRLPQFLANQNVKLPANMTQPMVAVVDGNIMLAFKYDSERISQVVSLHLKPSITVPPGGSKERPQLVLKLDAIRAGRLPFPVDSLVRGLRDSKKSADGKLDPTAATHQLANALEGKAIDPVMSVPSDRTRQIRLLAMDLTKNGADITVRLEPVK